MTTCKNCGGRMVGDGYSVPIHCETIETPLHEPDAQPEYCEEWDAEAWVATPSREDIARVAAEAREQAESEAPLHAEIARLRAELEAANAHVERLKMVLVNVYGELESATLHGAIITTIYSPELLPSVTTIFDYIDAAIDAARGGE